MINCAISISHSREKRRFESFRVDTSFAGHDGKWLFFAQEFMVLRLSKVVPAAGEYVRLGVWRLVSKSLSEVLLQGPCSVSLDFDRPWSEELQSWVSAGRQMQRFWTRRTADSRVAAGS